MKPSRAELSWPNLQDVQKNRHLPKRLPDELQTSRDSPGPLSTLGNSLTTTREAVNLTLWPQTDSRKSGPMFFFACFLIFNFFQLLSWTFPDLPGVSGSIRNALKPPRKSRKKTVFQNDAKARRPRSGARRRRWPASRWAATAWLGPPGP